jgi:hypothetical protein
MLYQLSYVRVNATIARASGPRKPARDDEGPPCGGPSSLRIAIPVR